MKFFDAFFPTSGVLRKMMIIDI